MALHVCLHHGTGLVARAIQFQTRSYWNHVSLLEAETDTLTEALEGRGVIRSRKLADVRQTETVQVFRVKGMTLAGQLRTLRFLNAQLGKPYDVTMVLRFISRQQANRKEAGKWFCSELAFAALREGGVTLLERVEPWAVSPGILAMSPFLIEEAA